MINCAFIGFGKSTTRYHLPYVLIREKFNVKRIFNRTRKPELEAQPQYKDISFTDDVYDILNDESIKLVSVCTHPDTHFHYARLCIEHGKNVLVEKPFTTTVEEAKILFAMAKEKGIQIFPYQNRRFDSCFLTTKKVIESGKIGDVVEIESHFDHFRPDSPTQPGQYFDGAFYGLGVHTLDQIISIWGRPEAVSYDIRSLRNKQNPDDTFEAQLFYGDRKAIVKTSHLVMSEYPKFIVHGTRGSFIKYGVDQQESFLKANIMPDADGFGRDHRLGLLEYIDENGTQHKEAVVNEQGDYGQVYDSVYESIVNAKPAFISEFEAITNLEILERAFSQPSPATIRLEQVEK